MTLKPSMARYMDRGVLLVRLMPTGTMSSSARPGHVDAVVEFQGELDGLDAAKSLSPTAWKLPGTLLGALAEVEGQGVQQVAEQVHLGEAQGGAPFVDDPRVLSRDTVVWMMTARLSAAI